MAFWSIAAFRAVLATETDADSPGSEELLGQLRENYEALTMLAFDTGETGTVTTIAETILTDSGQAWGVDEHNGKTLLITSGTAIGNIYTIDDTAATTLTCTGDTLVSDGVAINDTFKVLYDLKVNTDGHDHDGVNSKHINVPHYVGAHPTDIDHNGTSFSQRGGWPFYKQAYHETAYYRFEHRNTAGDGDTRIRFTDSSTSISGSHAISQGASWAIITSSASIASLNTGWCWVQIYLKADSSGDASHVRRFGAYVD